MVLLLTQLLLENKESEVRGTRKVVNQGSFFTGLKSVSVCLTGWYGRGRSWVEGTDRTNLPVVVQEGLST